MSDYFLDKAMYAIRAPALGELSSSGRMILLILAQISRDDPKDPLFAKSWLTHQQIANRVPCSVNTVRKEVAKLRKARVISVDPEDPENPGRWQYYFQIEHVEKLAALGKAHSAYLDAENRTLETERKRAYRDKKKSEERQKILLEHLTQEQSTAVDKPSHLRVVS